MQDVGMMPPYDAGYDDFEEMDEEDEISNWWHYSRFALPFLVFLLACLFTVFALTFWQQAGTVKDQFDGVPRVLMRDDINESDDEAGMPKSIRNLRFGSVFFGALGVFGAFMVFFARPAPGLRKGLCFLCAFFLIVSGVLAWIAFGVGLDKFERAEQCPENHFVTGAPCLSREGYAVAALAISAGVGLVTIVAAIQLVFNAKRHWRLPARGYAEEEQDRIREPLKQREAGAMVQKYVSYVRRWLVALSLIGAGLLLVALLVFTIILHEDRDVEFLRGPRGRSYRTLDENSLQAFEHAGWPTHNTRLRYAAVAIGILTILFNFLPFRSKTMALIFAFFYFISACLLVLAFGFDIHELNAVDDLPCPFNTLNVKLTCLKAPFIATAFFDFFTAICLLAYLFLEYVVNGKRQTTYTQEAINRPYGVFMLPKEEVFGSRQPVKAVVHNQPQTFDPTSDYRTCTMCNEVLPRADMVDHVTICASRPVSCEACGETVSNKELHSHRVECGEVLVRCEVCDDQLQRYRLSAHQQHECPRRMVCCDQCGEAMPALKMDRHKATECGSHTPESAGSSRNLLART